MNALLLAILLCDPTAIEFAWAQATADAPAEVSIVAPKVEPQEIPATRQVTKYRLVRQRYNCRGGQCSYRWVKQAYTVTVNVPAESATKETSPRYPTSPRQRPWTQGGKHITWRHLLEGEHKVWKFDPAWLASLTQTEVEQLHADCHEGKVRTNFIVRKEP